MSRDIPIILPELQYRDSTKLFNDDNLQQLLQSIVNGVEQLVSASNINELSPDVAAWAGHGIALCSYGMAVQSELKERGLSHSPIDLAALQYLCAARQESAEYPRWTYDISMVSAHRKVLEEEGNGYIFADPPVSGLFLREQEYDGEDESFYAFRPTGPFHRIFGWFWVDERNRPNKQWLRGTNQGTHEFVGGPLQGFEVETPDLLRLNNEELVGYSVIDSDENMLGEPVLVWSR